MLHILRVMIGNHDMTKSDDCDMIIMIIINEGKGIYYDNNVIIS